jgi:hypothetical protein
MEHFGTKPPPMRLGQKKIAATIYLHVIYAMPSPRQNRSTTEQATNLMQQNATICNKTTPLALFRPENRYIILPPKELRNAKTETKPETTPNEL